MNHEHDTTVSTSIPEDADKGRLQTLSDEELFEECVQRLLVSYDLRGTTFHRSHDAVSLARLECERRSKPEIFDKAFRAAFYHH